MGVDLRHLPDSLAEQSFRAVTRIFATLKSGDTREALVVSRCR